MLRRILSAYLWIAPLFFIPLWFVYHKFGLGAGILGAAAHLVVMAFGMWARGMFKWEAVPTAYGLARLLLTAGGAIVWIMGAAGPPRPNNITLAFYNNLGLITGFFVTLLGLTALKTELQREKRGALAAVGHASYSFSFVVWILMSFLIWGKLRTPGAALPETQRPDWLLFISHVDVWVWSVMLASSYIAGAAFASAGILTGRIDRWSGRLMVRTTDADLQPPWSDLGCPENDTFLRSGGHLYRAILFGNHAASIRGNRTGLTNAGTDATAVKTQFVVDS
jgi:hypothetical protein